MLIALKKKIPVFLLSATLLLIEAGIAIAQKKEPINIINADELEYSQVGGIKVRKLTGNVQLEQNNVTLFCHQANYFLDKNVVDATGNVRIRQGDSINVFSDQLHYDGNSKKATLNRNVKLTDMRLVLTTEDLDYDLGTRIASFQKGGTVVNDEAVLTSKRGYYFANTSDVFFKKEVKLVHPEYVLTSDTLRFNTVSKTAFFISPTYIHSDSFDVYCEKGYYNTEKDIAQFEKNATLKQKSQSIKADTIYYERLSGFGIARSNITWADTASKIFMKGNFMKYNQNKEIVTATKNALLIVLLDSDSLYMAADTFKSYKTGTTDTRLLLAYHHVRLFKSDLQGVCDSLAYSSGDSTFRLFIKPVLWVDNNQLKADTINITLRNKQIDQLQLNQNSFAANVAQGILYNQVRGKKMTGYFLNGNLQRMEVTGNGESIYYAEDENGGFIGVNKAVCSNMILYFDSARKISRINFITKPDATLYPLALFPEDESRLKNFVWLDALRPKSKEELRK